MGLLRTARSVLRFRRFEWNPTERRLHRAVNIDDLRLIAKRRLPAGVFDYIDGGAEDEITLSRNSQGFRELEFQPRVMRDVSAIDLTTEILGRRTTLPLILAPTGFTRIAHSAGELAVARAAEKAGIPYVLSSLSTRSIEEIRSTSGGELWFQVYVWVDKGLLSEMLQRAAAAGYSTIVITVDTPVLGHRERDVRRGFTLPPKVGLRTMVDGILHPRWTWDFLHHDPIRFANVVGKSVGDGADAVSLSGYIVGQFDPSLSWTDIEWFRDRWNGKIVIKGIQTVEDAIIAVQHQVDAIALSNHGGRQLDGAPPPIELVGPVVDTVGDQVEVYCDGGVRRGSDIVKAAALGATACMVGRAYLYGLASGGQRGVEHAVALIEGETRRSLALTGRTSFADVDRTLVSLRGQHIQRGSSTSYIREAGPALPDQMDDLDR